MSPRERVFYLRLGHELRKQREARRRSQLHLALELGVSHVAIGNWERGYRRISLYQYERLQMVLRRTAA